MKSTKLLLKILALALAGTVFCILTGFVIHGSHVFNFQSPFFQFITFGMLGSVSFALFRFRRFSDSVYIDLLLFLLLYLAWGRHHVLTLVFYFSGIILFAYIHAIWLYERIAFNFVRPFVAGVLLSLIFLIVTIVLMLIYYSGRIPFFPFKNMPLGFLMGFGMAVGFEAAEWVNGKFIDGDGLTARPPEV